MKKMFMVFLSVVLVLSLAACGANTGSSTSVNNQYKQEISSAAKKLDDTYTNYIVATTVDFSDLSQEYIEVIKGDDIYTEFSVDADGNVGVVEYGSADTISYALANWTNGGSYYSLGYDDAGAEVWYKYPDNYATKYEYDREMLYVNRLLAGATNIEEYEDLDLTLGGVSETFKAYRITVDSETVKEILSSDTWGVYNSIKDGEKSNSNITKLCDFYLQDIELMNTYSIGKVIVGIDQNGILKFMSLEVGGLGTTLYVTKAVVDISNPNVRETPDFSNSIPIVSTMTELADFVAQFDDYDSAVKGLQSMYNDELAAYQSSLLEGGLTDSGVVDETTDPDTEEITDQGELGDTGSVED